MVDPSNNNTPLPTHALIQPSAVELDNNRQEPSNSQAQDWFLPKNLTSQSAISATQVSDIGGNTSPELLADRVLSHLGV